VIGKKALAGIIEVIPFAKYNLGWVLPSVLTLILLNFNRKPQEPTLSN
jgi:branched-subunit amino acid permease